MMPGAGASGRDKYPEVVGAGMVRALPVFEGYTVDARLQEFRRVDRERLTIEFVRFDSERGKDLLSRMGDEWDWLFEG